MGVSSSASVLRSLVGMWSGPVALCSLGVHISFVNAIWCYYYVLYEWVWANAFVRNGGCVFVFGRILIGSVGYICWLQLGYLI